MKTIIKYELVINEALRSALNYNCLLYTSDAADEL